MISLSYACGLLAVFKLLSPDISEFLDVPSWCPSGVDSAHTFGSPDATNTSHRITADTIASAFSTFGAFSERAYYVNAGDRNRWDTGTYGPTQTKTFRFTLPTNAPTPYCYDPDTNRAIRTRRFIEYHNITNLATHLAQYRRLDDLFHVERPSWTNAVRRWGSSGFKTFGDIHFPDFVWTDTPVDQLYDSNTWARVCMSFDFCKQDGGQPLHWGESSSLYSVPYEAWSVANYGQPPFDDFDVFEVKIPKKPAYTNTPAEIVGAMFGEHNCTNIITEVASNSVYLADAEGRMEAALAEICNEVLPYSVMTNYTRDAFTNLTVLVRGAGDERVVTQGRTHTVVATLECYLHLSEDIQEEAPVEPFIVEDFGLIHKFYTESTPDIDDLDYEAPMMYIFYIRWFPAVTQVQFLSDYIESPYPFKYCDASITFTETNIVEVLSALVQPTPRLWPEQIAAVNRCLGALDTFVSPVDCAIVHTNVKFVHEATFETGMRTIQLDWHATGMTCGLSDPWGGWQLQTNTVQMFDFDGGRYESSNEVIHAASKTSSSVAMYCDRRLYLGDAIVQVSDIEEGVLRQITPEGRGDIIIRLTGVGSVEVRAIYSPYAIAEIWANLRLNGGSPISFTPASSMCLLPEYCEVQAKSKVTREYFARYPVEYNIVSRSPSQATSAIVDRDNSRAWMVASSSRAVGNSRWPITHPLLPIHYTSRPLRTQSFEATSQYSTFGSSAACNTALTTIFNGIKQRIASNFHTDVGCYADDPLSYVPAGLDPIRGAIESVELEEVPLEPNLAWSPNVELMIGTYANDQGNVTFNWQYFIAPDGTTIAPSASVRLGSFNMNISSAVEIPKEDTQIVERYGAVDGAKISPWTRTHYNWKCLRAVEQ